jgi:putative oxidoreductase
MAPAWSYVLRMNPNIMLSVLRIVAGALFVEHGTQKILNFPPGTMHPALNSLAGVSGLIELIGGTLFLLGLFTRVVAFILSGEMAVAYFLVHAKAGFFPLVNKGELAVLYCFVFLYFVFAGGGLIGLDAALKRK